MGNTAKRAFKSFWNDTVPNFFSKAWKWTKREVFRPVADAVSGVFGGARDLIIDTEKQITSTITSVASTAGTTISSVGNNIEGVSSNLSLPLIAGAAAVGIYFLMGNKIPGR